MAIRQVQANFSHGELDPKLFTRSDVDVYYKGAEKLRNVLVIPQGGASRRFGTTFTATINDNAGNPVTDIDEVNAFIYDLDQDETFTIVVRPYDRAGPAVVGFDIYENNMYVTTVSSADYKVDEIKDLYFVRLQGFVVILHEDVQPHQLKRTGASWAITTVSIVNYPVFDFSTIDGVSYRATGNTFTPSATTGIGITVTGSAAFFNQGHVGGIYIGNGGIARITAVNAAGTVATVTTIENFAGTTAILGTNSILSSAAWGDTSAGAPAGKNRGWPSKGTLFQNRLALANSAALPNIVWVSNLGDPYNFDDAEALADNAFSIGVGKNGNEEIQDIVGTKALVAFGFSGVYASSLFVDTPITPSTAYLLEQPGDGSANLRVQTLDNQMFFIDENDQQVNALVYSIEDSGFSALNASLLSPQLINTPVSTAAYRPANNDGSLLMVINADGTMGIFQSLSDQSVRAWSLSDTRGSFKKAYASRSTAYMLNRRSFGTTVTVAGLIDNVYTANSSFDGLTDVSESATDPLKDVTIFANDLDYLIVGHESPYYTLGITLATVANATLNPTFEYLDNTKTWTAFTPSAEGTSGLTVNGDVVWDLDAQTPNWKPIDLEKTGVHIPQNTINGTETKFWMRIQRVAPGNITFGFIVDPAFSTFTNISASLSDPAVDATLFSQDNEYLLLGHASTYSILNIALNTAASADIAATYEYMDSTGAWVVFVPTADTTVGFTGAGAITWGALADWSPMTVNGNANMYWIRIKRTIDALVTAPIEDTIFMNIVTAPVESTLLINVADRIHLEMVDYSKRTDCSLTKTSDAAGLVIGLTHLVGQQVYVVADEIPEGPYYVNTAGEITIKALSAAVVKVGLNYIPSITPMPLVARDNTYNTLFYPKHVKDIFVYYFESLGLLVNGQEIPTLQIGGFVLDQIPNPVTGFYPIVPMRGWSPTATYTVSQELPLPMTVLGIGYTIEVS